MHPRVTIARFEPPRRQCGARYVQDQVRRLRPRGSTALLAILALASTWVLVPQGRAVAASERRGSGVLPPSARPAGYSLADMTRLLALFTTSGNDPSRYPDTPFQILYTNPDPTLNQTNFVTKDHAPCPTPKPPNPQCGYFSTQTGAFSNTFRVEPGTTFFVPVDNADDSPPVVEPFPTTPRGAKSYVFDPQQLGGRGFTVIIDSKSVPLGPRYVAGPVETPPLLDVPPGTQGGTHIITLGAFLGPLTPGIHTVRIKGGYFGAGIERTYQFAFVSEDFTYQIEVTSD